MSIRYRLLAVFLAVNIILSLAPGCGKNKSGEDNESSGNIPASKLHGIVAEAEDGIGEPGKDFALLKTGPADDWGSMSAPKFNPLGARALYSGAEYLGSDGEDVLFYTLDGYIEKRESRTGERWELSIADPDYSLRWLRWYTREAGGKWYQGTQDHSSFFLPESETVSWWADARQTEEGVDLTVLKINVLPVGMPLTLRPGEAAGGSYVFYTPPTNGKLQSAAIILKGAAECGFSLDISSSMQRGGFSYQTNLTRWEETLSLKKAERFILDDLPIAEGELCWKLGWGEKTPPPEEITLQLDAVAEITPVTWGEQPGAIRITGIPVGEAKVYAPEWAEISHREVSIFAQEVAGVTEPDGNMLFAAPAGYYNIRLNPGADGMDQNYLRLIPVNAGEITTVNIPPEVSVGAGALSRLYGDFDQNEGGVELLGNKADGDTATATFILNDPQERDLFPQKEDIKISEDGAAAVVTDLQREPAGSDVVLVLDTSGSMGENMKPCVEAAKRFVESLPENTKIRLVQFAQKITEHKAADKAGVIAALDTVKEGGATALYDATARALSLLKDKKRGYAVVFSDGADSREPGVDGEGSAMDKEQLLAEIRESGVTVLTIGFGAGHDPATLIAMSAVSKGGGYFAAANKEALAGAFATVAGKFGNQFTVTYQRPIIPKDQDGTVAVVSMLIDRSGSMDADPIEEEGVGWRIERIREMFHGFVLKLPDDTLMQLGSFAAPMGGAEPRFDQLITDQKASILQALGSLEAGGGTPTKTALEMAYYNLAPVPSQKRALVFFTDAGLYDPENPDELNEILSLYRASGIRVLFAGLNDDTGAEMEGIFKTAAQKARGDYILTSDIGKITQKLDELLSKLQTPSLKQGVDFTLGVDCEVPGGGRVQFYTSKGLAEFITKTGAGKRIDPQIIACKTGEPYAVYNRDAAKLLYGGDQPVAQSNVLLRLPFANATESNRFAKLTVTEAYLLNMFKGIPAPAGKRYLALNTTLEFAKSDPQAAQVGYSVPNIFNHFYLSANEGRMAPPSEATWLAEKPFAIPGESDVTVFEKEPRSGMLIFLTDLDDGENLTQLSLHLYDTENGHIQLPLAGVLPDRMLKIDALPTETPVRMSDTFTLSVTGTARQTALEGVELQRANAEFAAEDARRNASFLVVEAKFDSKIQALLAIDPTERFLYQLETDQGVLMTPMSGIVHRLPLGFTGETMLAPGSCSRVRMPFVLPDELLGMKGSVYADLATGSQQWVIKAGQPYVTGGDGKRFSHEYFDLTVNALCLDAHSGAAVLDFTIHDKKDGEGTGGLESVLQLERGEPSQESAAQQMVAGRSGLGSFAGGNEDIVTASFGGTNRLVFGAIQEDGTWGAFDGQSRRGILVFEISGEDPSGWTLTSPLLPDLRLPVSPAAYPHLALLAEKPEIERNSDFEKALEEAVAGAVAAYEATRPAPRDRVVTGLSDEEIMGKQVPSPALTLYGSQRVKAVESYEDFRSLMNSLGWVPAGGEPQILYRYAPEAVITQGWGGQHDLAVLAKTLLARLGYRPEYRTVTLTAAGQENLCRIGGVEEAPKTLTGIFYTDEAGAQKLFLPVLNADLSELHGLAYLSIEEAPVDIQPSRGRLIIQLYGKLSGNAADIASANAGLWDALGASLSGEEGEGGIYETVTLLERELSLPDLSLDALDISYLSKPKADGGVLLLPILDTRQGLIYDPNSWIDSSYYTFERLNIIVEDGESRATHTTMLPEGQKLSEITHTLAWGVPELTEAGAKAIEEMAKAEAGAAKEPANYSVSRWLGHATINRLIRGLTAASREIANTLGLTVGRSNQSIALLVTTKSDGKTAETTVDLLNHRNQIHSEDENAIHAYNLMYGYFASDMEAAALPGGEGVGYTKVWQALPQGAKIIQLAIEEPSSLEAVKEQYSEESFPPLLWERMSGEDGSDPPQTLYLVPDQPAQIDGKPRWAWLEIDMVSYDVISVFETGERAGMGEYLIGCLPGNGNYGEVGAGMLTGVATAVGSVAAYTLTGEDYQTVLKMAAAKCEEIGAIMGIVTGVTGAIDAGGKIREGVSGKQLEKLFEANEGIWVNKLTFGDGYSYAVKAYFKSAQTPPPPPEPPKKSK